MTDAGLTPLGELLERARGGLSKREAARRAGISEGRWRQIVTGQQKAGGGITVPANPRRETVIAMAGAVRTDIPTALVLAGFDAEDAPGTTPTKEHDAVLIDAISNHPGLLPEAKEHLRNQFELLLRIASPATPVTDSQPPVEAPPEGDSRVAASRARHERLRTDVRGQQRPDKERERGTGTQGDG